MQFLFFISLGIVVYTYFGYPIILAFLSLVMNKRVKKEDIIPQVSILISAYNEEKTIEDKIKNLLELDYPREKMEIIIGSDGSTDETYQILRKYSEENKIRYIVSFQHMGKPAMLNKLAKEAQREILIFADARQRFDKQAIRELVKNFADPDVGCVSGELILEDKETGTGCGLSLYWAYEKFLRNCESRIGSMLGATGAIYAIRRAQFIFFPEDILLDDVYAPLKAVLLKKRAIFEPAAKAYDVVSQTAEKEFFRKVRTLAGNFQLFSMMPEIFNPARSLVAFQLFSHKLLRLLVPYFLIFLFITNISLIEFGRLYTLALFLQGIFYVLAVIGYLLGVAEVKMKGFLRKLFYVPLDFCVLNAAAVVALFLYYWRGRVEWGK